MDNITTYNDLLNKITFEIIIDYFKGRLLSSNESFWSYEFIHHSNKNIYHFFYEEYLKCYSESDLRCISTTELIYSLTEKHKNSETVQLITELSEYKSTTQFHKIQSKRTVDITNSILKLVQLSDEHQELFSLPILNILKKPFQGKVFLHMGKLAFPLSMNKIITNILLLDTDGNSQTLLNNNTGVFASTLPYAPDQIAVFFNARTMIGHKNRIHNDNIFYLLFGNSISYLQIEKLIDLSHEKNRSIELFSELSQVDDYLNFFNLLQVYISRVETIFDTLYLQYDQSKFTLFFSAKNKTENYLPLIEYLNSINKAIIVFYNGEIPTVANDVTVQQNLIKSDTWKDKDIIRLSITFPKNMEVLFLVFNTILKSLHKDLITFNILKDS